MPINLESLQQYGSIEEDTPKDPFEDRLTQFGSVEQSASPTDNPYPKQELKTAPTYNFDINQDLIQKHLDLTDRASTIVQGNEIMAQRGFDLGSLPKSEEEFELQDLERRMSFEASVIEKSNIQDQLGNRPVNLNKSDIDSLWVREQLSTHDNFLDQHSLLTEKYPDYKFFTVKTKDNENAWFYTNPKDGVSYPVDPSGFELGDVAEAVGDISPLQMFVEGGLAYLTKGRNVAVRTGSSVLGGATSPYIRQQIDKYRGLQGAYEETLASESAIGAGLGVAGELGGFLLKRLDRATGLYGMFEEDFGGEVAKEIANKYDLKPLSAFQLNSILERKSKQLRGTQKEAFESFEQEQDVSLFKSLKEWEDSFSNSSLSFEERDQLHKNVVSGFMDVMTNPNISLKEGGEQLGKSLDDYILKEREYFSKAYDDVYSAADGNVSFNISKVQSNALNIQRGVEAPSLEGSIRITPEFTPSMEKALNEVQQILPQFSDTDVDSGTALEVMKGLRKKFYELSQPSNGKFRNEAEGKMYSIYKDISSSISTPSGGGEQFIENWTKVNDEYKTFMQIQDLKEVTNILDNAQPEKLVRRLFQPENETVMEVLQNRLNPEQWTKFTDSIKTDLLADPSSLYKRLDQFKGNDKTLNYIFTNGEIQSLKTLGRKIERIDNSQIAQVLQGSKDAIPAIMNMVGNGETTLLREYINKGGPEFESLLKLGVLSDVMRKSSTEFYKPLLDAEGNTVGKELAYKVDPRKYISTINELKKSGVLDEVFGAEGEQLIERAFYAMRRVGASSSSMADSLQASEIVADLTLTNLFRHPDQFLTSAIHLRTNKWETAVLLSDSFSNIVFGTNPHYRPGPIASNLREASVSGLQALNHLQDWGLNKEIIPEEFKLKMQEIKDQLMIDAGEQMLKGSNNETNQMDQQSETQNTDYDLNDIGRLSNGQ